LGALRRARARQRSWRWPWDRLEPDSATGERRLRKMFLFSGMGIVADVEGCVVVEGSLVFDVVSEVGLVGGSTGVSGRET